MKKCRTCQMEIDEKAKKCPHCQAKQGNWLQRHPILTILIVLIVLIGVTNADSDTADEKMATKTTEPTVVTETTKTMEPTTEAMKSEFMVGEAIQMTDYVLTVNEVTTTPSKGYSTPKTGNEYVMINVTIQNQSDKEVSYNPFDFKIQDSNGNQTQSTFVSLDDQLNSGSLAAGGKVTGSLAFEAPKGDESLLLIYQPNVWLDTQRITVNLQ